MRNSIPGVSRPAQRGTPTGDVDQRAHGGQLVGEVDPSLAEAVRAAHAVVNNRREPTAGEELGRLGRLRVDGAERPGPGDEDDGGALTPAVEADGVAARRGDVLGHEVVRAATPSSRSTVDSSR
jgi:hypothetical protein